MNSTLSELLTSLTHNMEQPERSDVIFKYYRCHPPHEQYDLIEALYAADSISNVEKFYIDIAPTYLSPIGMKYFLPLIMAEMVKGNDDFLAFASFVMGNTYDPLSEEETDIERFQLFKEILSTREKEIFAIGFNHLSMIDHENPHGQSEQFLRIANYTLN